jgi:hypothetical protein
MIDRTKTEDVAMEMKSVDIDIDIGVDETASGLVSVSSLPDSLNGEQRIGQRTYWSQITDNF